MNGLVAVGIALAVAAVGSTAASMTQTLLRTERTQVRELPGPVQDLDLDLDTGDVRIVGVSGASGVLVERTETWSVARPEVSEELVGGTLRVRAACAAALSWCDVSYVLRVPAGTRVLVRTGSGEVQASGTGSVRADTGSGDVRLEDVTGGAEVRSGSGEVVAQRVDGEALVVRTGSGDLRVTGAGTDRVTARTGSGEVRLALRRPPEQLRVDTGSGDVEVALPDGPDAYDVRVDTGSGERDVRVRTDPSGGRPLDLRTGSGDVTVRYG